MITFETLGLPPFLLKAVSELNYQQPTDIQKEVIPFILNHDNDVVALAQTGTGKTAAFGLPIVQLINPYLKEIQCLILAPTRELCLQITDDLIDFSKYIDLQIVPVYGGASIETQLKALKKGTHIVVATPGRLIDIIQRKGIHLNKVQFLVLDEADEMLNMGFANDIQTILSQLPPVRRTFLFSATMPNSIAVISQKYMRNPIEITIGRKNSSAKDIQHAYYVVHAKDKYSLLKRIIDLNPDLYGIIFCRTKKETQEIADKLMHDGYNADALHGDLSQSQRDFVMSRFRLRQLDVLVATDVAARGIDVEDLTHVIHYSLPDDIEIYTHRSGRTGRAGKKGISIAITHLREKNQIKEIEKNIQCKFIRLPLPTNKEICEKQLFHLINKIEHVEVNAEEIEPFLPLILKKLSWLDRDELIKRLVSIEFNRFLDYYKDAKEISEPIENEYFQSKKDKKINKVINESNGMIRMYINLGKSQGIYPNQIIKLLNKSSLGKRIKIGKIQLFDNFSFFEIPQEIAEQVVENLSNTEYEGRIVIIDFAEKKRIKGKGKGKDKIIPRLS